LALLPLLLRPSEPGFDTPAACLEAFRDACKDGDAPDCRRCLAESLRAGSADLFEVARRDLQEVRHWNQYAPEIRGDAATTREDRVGAEGLIHCVDYRRGRARPGWQIVAVGPAEIIRPPVRPGTHVNDTAP